MMNEIKLIALEKIHPNPYQPRVEFETQSLNELARSIEENGLIQPIVVREVFDEYEIIAGERRYRACKIANVEMIPCVVMKASEMETAQIALVENIQRENLNAIEEAKAYVQMMRMSSLTQEELAKRVGKKQSTIANKIRLLNLSDEIKGYVINREITERHARALLSVPVEKQSEMLQEILSNKLTVQQTETRIASTGVAKKRKPQQMKMGFTRNVEIARNTILQAIDMIKKTNIEIDTLESDSENDYVITIHIKK
jgi:ParB-like partition proteins